MTQARLLFVILVMTVFNLLSLPPIAPNDCQVLNQDVYAFAIHPQNPRIVYAGGSVYSTGLP